MSEVRGAWGWRLVEVFVAVGAAAYLLAPALQPGNELGSAADLGAAARRWWWSTAATCSSQVAWPVGKCGLGELGGFAELALAGIVATQARVAFATVVLNVLAVATAARALGASRGAGLLLGVLVGAGPGVTDALGAASIGGALAWPTALVVLAWHRAAAAPTGLSWLVAACLTLATGLAGPASAGAALLVALALSSGGSPILLVVAAAASLGGLALAAAALSAGPPQPSEALVVAGSLRPGWFVASPVAVPLVVCLGAALACSRASPLDRRLAAAFVGLWALALGPRLLGPEGPAEGSHLPLAAWGALPGLAAFDMPRHFAVPAAVVAGLLTARVATNSRMLAMLALGVLLELGWRGLPPRVSSVEASRPAWAEAVAELEQGVVVVLPLSPELRAGDPGIAAAAVHRHPLLEAPRAWIAEYRPEGWQDAIDDSPFLTEWRRFERGRDDPADPRRANYFRHDPAELAALAERGPRFWVVVDAHYAGKLRPLAAASREMLARVAGEPRLRGEGWALWDLRGASAAPELLAPPWRMPAPLRGLAWPADPAR